MRESKYKVGQILIGKIVMSKKFNNYVTIIRVGSYDFADFFVYTILRSNGKSVMVYEDEIDKYYTLSVKETRRKKLAKLNNL